MLANTLEYKTHNDKHIFSGGTFVQGEIQCDYQRLVDLFGKPTGSDGYKSDAEWVIEFPDHARATIYNWKNGRNYLGDAGLPVEQIGFWHVGGDAQQAHRLVSELVG